MNSGKNPSMNTRRLVAPFAMVSLLGVGCSTFSRSNPDAQNAAEKDGKTVYSAKEGDATPATMPAPATAADLKDQKIQHLESTIVSLNTRVQELEGKLQAAHVRPDYSTGAENSKASQRQAFDALNSIGKVHASVAGNDPGAGFVNDAAVRAFQQGKILLDQEKFPESILAFSAFLEGNSNHPLASSAQYYIGENYYRQGDFAVADQEFQKLASRYPQSSRLSFALVRLSQSAGALGKADESKRYRTQVEGLFPKSPALKLFREKPVTSNSDSAAAPIATAPDLAIERPTVPAIAAPTVETPTIEKPAIEKADMGTPPAEFPTDSPSTGNAPRAHVSGGNSGSDLDAPPGSGG
jgi:TolA-binding protein